MKSRSFILGLLLLWSGISAAQKAPYHVVFDVTSNDTLVHQMVARWVGEIANANPDAKIEVVFYGKSLGMVTQGKSVVASQVIKASANKNVAFKVCAIAMKNNKVEKSQLLHGVQIVPDGIYEIVSRQHDGWGYIKASR